MLDFYTAYFGFIAFFVGASLASYMNVMVYRIPIGKNVAYPPSSCPNCNHKIRWYENIPVFSWLFLKGKCSSCGLKISPQYVITEFLFGVFTATYFFAVGMNEILSVQYISLYFMIYFLLTLSLIDIKTKMIPISLILLAFFSGLLVNPDYESSIIYGLASLGFFYMFKLTYEYFRGIEVLGEGDLPILGLFGALFGLTPNFSIALMISAATALVLFVVFYRNEEEPSIPFVPGLSIGLVSVYLFQIFA